MAVRITSSTLIALAGALAACIAAAETQDRIDLDAEIATGIEYDSNVSVVDLDTSTGQADGAFLTDVGLGADIGITQAIELKLGYDWSQKRYQEFSDFDLSIHRASAALEYKTGIVDTGLALHHVDAQLGGNDYLGIRRFSPSVAKLFGERLYLRGAYVRTGKNHRRDEGRAAVNDGFSADAYLFLDGPSRYIALGWLVASEDAANDEFDYDRHRLKLLYAQGLDWPRIDVELKASLQLERRRYAQLLEPLLPATGTERRSDDRLRAALLIDVPLDEWIAIESGIEYASNASNLQSADFDEMSYSVSLAAAF